MVKFNIAEVKFVQKYYDQARPAFSEILNDKSDLADLANYKVFLCDLFGGHEDAAKKDLDVFNQVASKPSYFYANVAWSVYHKQVEDARSYLGSAEHIYTPQKKTAFTPPASGKSATCRCPLHRPTRRWAPRPVRAQLLTPPGRDRILQASLQLRPEPISSRQA